MRSKFIVIGEYGLLQAMFGLGLSHGLTSGTSFAEFSSPNNPLVVRCLEVARKLHDKDGGHNKFLESIQIWLDVTMPRGVWVEADTYRAGSSKQSESTMHTIHKRELAQEDFDQDIPESMLTTLNQAIVVYRADRSVENLVVVKNMLPEGFLQRRIWNINYKTLRSIVAQRKDHRLPHWKTFCAEVLGSINHPEWVV